MREIKFRAWINEESSWHRDSGVDTPCMEYDFAFEEYMTINQELYKMQTDNHILMQYTGLKDKNGQEIYEGDCYTAKHKSGKVYTGQVKYDLSFVFDIEGFEELFINGVGAVKTNRTFDIHSFIKWFDEVEVFGNIYENPELLKAAE
ncbi:hypothetical protein EF83_21785 [Bacillus subtilis]|nr:hypothetical protein EF83_21785 [Bacillus subtilis]